MLRDTNSGARRHRAPLRRVGEGRRAPARVGPQSSPEDPAGGVLLGGCPRRLRLRWRFDPAPVQHQDGEFAKDTAMAER